MRVVGDDSGEVEGSLVLQGLNHGEDLDSARGRREPLVGCAQRKDRTRHV